MVRIVLDNRCPPQRAQHVFRHDILFRHLLMGVRCDANTLSLRLKGEAISDSCDVARIHIRHDFKTLRCIRGGFKICSPTSGIPHGWGQIARLRSLGIQARVSGMSPTSPDIAPDEDTMIVEIADLAYRGKGVARHDGMVVFVPGAWPGERVRIALALRRKRFGEGRVLEVLTPSPHRVAAECPLADRCPGCAYQRLAYPEEVRWKQTQLDTLLERQAGLAPAERPTPLASPRPTGYRNKIVLHAARADSGQTLLGYFGADNTTILDVPVCPLARPDLQARLTALRAKSGFMRSLRPGAALTLRTTAHDGPQHWVDAPPAQAPELTETTAIGPLRVPRDAFFQVNPEAGALLLETVRAWVRERQPRAVVDLYCGVGVFALAAARDGVPLVRGVDDAARGIAAARANAAALDLRAEFASAPAEAGLAPALGDLAPAETLLIVDPPRTGLAPAVVAGIVRHRPAHLLYVSCAPDTLARDLRPLAAAGYRLDRIQLVDLFPRTPYFETVALLTAPL